MESGNETVPIGDGSVLIDVPQIFTVEIDQDGTVDAVLSTNAQLFTLRFSVLTVGAKDPKKTKEIDLAAEIIADAQNGRLQVQRQGDKAWYCQEQSSVENGKPIWLQFWHVGYRNRRGIFSLCCSASQRAHAQLRETVSVVPSIIQSLRVRNERSPLTPMEASALEKQRAVIAQVLREKFDCYSLPRLKADLAVLQNVIDRQAFGPKQTHEWSCLGVTFGDILAGELGLDWIAYSDELGAEPALNLSDTSIVVFPRTMILKRAERGERADLEDLFQWLEQKVEEFRAQGH